MRDKKTPPRVTESEIRRKLEVACAKADSIAAWARENGVHRQLVYDAMAGKRPGTKVLARLGYRRVPKELEYEEIE